MTELIKQSFKFEDNKIRIIENDDLNPWFIAKDITNILGLTNVSESTKLIPDKWKKIEKIMTSSGEQDMIIISEAGLYKLIMRSNKPIAQPFQEWICEEVLPTIRNTGEFKLEEYQKKIEQQQKNFENSQKELEKSKKELEKQELEIKQLNVKLKRKFRKKHKDGNCVYILKNPDVENAFKIGSTKSQNNRKNTYNGSTPNETEFLHQYYIPIMRPVEDTLLFIFDKHRTESIKKREWIKLSLETLKEEMDGLCNYIIERRKIYDPEYNNDDSENEVIDEDEIPTKVCIRCNDSKELDEFYERIENVDGKENICKPCYVERQIEAKNKAKILLKEHVAEAGVKKCTKCKLEHSLDKFKLLEKSKDGYNYICSDCVETDFIDASNKTEKKCSNCHDTKCITEFTNCRTSVDGKFAYCKPCSIIKNKEYKAKRLKEGPTETVTEKICIGCKETKNVSEYTAHRGCKDGYMSKCRVCCNKDRLERQKSKV